MMTGAGGGTNEEGWGGGGDCEAEGGALSAAVEPGSGLWAGEVAAPASLISFFAAAAAAAAAERRVFILLGALLTAVSFAVVFGVAAVLRDERVDWEPRVAASSFAVARVQRTGRVDGVAGGLAAAAAAAVAAR